MKRDSGIPALNVNRVKCGVVDAGVISGTVPNEGVASSDRDDGIRRMQNGKVQRNGRIATYSINSVESGGVCAFEIRGPMPDS